MPVRVISVFLALQAFSCQDPVVTPETAFPPINTLRNILSLQVEDTTCTEVYLRVSIHDSTGGTHNVTLWRDSSIVGQFSALTGDTLFVDEGLLPDQPYIYTAVIENIDTAFVQTVTMPLTSHDFVWQTFTFGGDAGSCVFNDVAIVNDTLAYAVGEIYIKDTTHINGYQFYNAARWNGSTWELLRIEFSVECGGGSIHPPLSAVFALSPDLVIVAAGKGLGFYDGSSAFMDCRMTDLMDGSITKIFATGRYNIYLVGYNGAIVRYSNLEWVKIASGTSLHFYDIWGDQNKKTGEWEVLAVASNYGESPPGKAIVRIQNNNVIPIDATGTSNFLSNIWFRAGRKYYVCGDAVYETDATNNCTSEPCWSQEVTGWSSLGGIRGNEINDVVVVGINNFAAHFNGISWLEYAAGGFINNHVAIKENLVVSVGLNPNFTASIAVGKR